MSVVYSKDSFDRFGDDSLVTDWLIIFIHRGEVKEATPLGEVKTTPKEEAKEATPLEARGATPLKQREQAPPLE